MRYRKKPVVIDAMQLTMETRDAVYFWVTQTTPGYGCYIDEEGGLVIRTLEGPLHASEGDFIIRGVQGEFYPCKPAIFEATYEKVTDG